MIPRSKVVNEGWEGRHRNSFKNAHEYRINSLSLSADGEHFISSDDLRVNLWDISNSSVVFNVLDMKPEKVEECDDVIHHCDFHPRSPTVFLYSTNKGFIHICDFRDKSTF